MAGTDKLRRYCEYVSGVDKDPCSPGYVTSERFGSIRIVDLKHPFMRYEAEMTDAELEYGRKACENTKCNNEKQEHALS